MMGKFVVMFVMLLGIASAADPTYFGLALVHQAGPDGVEIDIGLADNTTNAVASSGILKIYIWNVDTHKIYLNKTINVNKTDFKMGTSRDSLRHPNPKPFFNVGRLVLDNEPRGESDIIHIAVFLVFIPPKGKALTDMEDIYWTVMP
jgi:hypothetical protein